MIGIDLDLHCRQMVVLWCLLVVVACFLVSIDEVVLSRHQFVLAILAVVLMQLLEPDLVRSVPAAVLVVVLNWPWCLECVTVRVMVWSSVENELNDPRLVVITSGSYVGKGYGNQGIGFAETGYLRLLALLVVSQYWHTGPIPAISRFPPGQKHSLLRSKIAVD